MNEHDPRDVELGRQAMALGLLERATALTVLARATAERCGFVEAARREGLDTTGLSRLMAEPTPGGLPRPGEQLAGYLLERVLGRGGMGAVYAAVGDTGARRAIKVSLADAGSEEELARAEREWLTLARLTPHPNVLRVHAAGRERGFVYGVIDLVEGSSAEDLAKGGGLAVDRALELAGQIARALAHVHAQGVFHRDLKPANVLVRPDGSAVLTDFGLARDTERERLTKSGTLLGTPAYMPPEQVESGVVDARSDVYSLGATLYELLTGKRPFEGDQLRILKQVLVDPPRPPRRLRAEIPADVEAVVLTAMEKEPGDRYATAEAFAVDLNRARRGDTVEARRPGFLARAVRWGERRPLRTALLGVAVIAPAVAIAVAAIFAARERTRADAWATRVGVTLADAPDLGGLALVGAGRRRDALRDLGGVSGRLAQLAAEDGRWTSAAGPRAALASYAASVADLKALLATPAPADADVVARLARLAAPPSSKPEAFARSAAFVGLSMVAALVERDAPLAGDAAAALAGAPILAPHRTSGDDAGSRLLATIDAGQASGVGATAELRDRLLLWRLDVLVAAWPARPPSETLLSAILEWLADRAPPAEAGRHLLRLIVSASQRDGAARLSLVLAQAPTERRLRLLDRLSPLWRDDVTRAAIDAWKPPPALAATLADLVWLAVKDAPLSGRGLDEERLIAALRAMSLAVRADPMALVAPRDGADVVTRVRQVYQGVLSQAFARDPQLGAVARVSVEAYRTGLGVYPPVVRDPTPASVQREDLFLHQLAGLGKDPARRDWAIDFLIARTRYSGMETIRGEAESRRVALETIEGAEALERRPGVPLVALGWARNIRGRLIAGYLPERIDEVIPLLSGLDEISELTEYPMSLRRRVATLQADRASAAAIAALERGDVASAVHHRGVEGTLRTVSLARARDTIHVVDERCRRTSALRIEPMPGMRVPHRRPDPDDIDQLEAREALLRSLYDLFLWDEAATAARELGQLEVRGAKERAAVHLAFVDVVQDRATAAALRGPVDALRTRHRLEEVLSLVGAFADRLTALRHKERAGVVRLFDELRPR